MGGETPYEINITYFDALKGTHQGIDRWQVPRFICAQTVMLALQGIPALYIHSMTATPNDYAGVERSGRTRTINRHVWQLEELQRLLQDGTTPQAEIFDELRRRIRRRQPAFHPESDQQTLDLGRDLFVVWRIAKYQRILAVNNMTDREQALLLPPHPCQQPGGVWQGRSGGRVYGAADRHIILKPYQSAWLEPKKQVLGPRSEEKDRGKTGPRTKEKNRSKEPELI
jgi:sucrose phosphorylase